MGNDVDYRFIVHHAQEMGLFPRISEMNKDLCLSTMLAYFSSIVAPSA